MIQQRFIKYSERFARDYKTDIWLSGSFLKGGFTKYSDVDIAVKTDDADIINQYIHEFETEPVYIGRTERPNGILIVIYKNGLALDLEIISSMDHDALDEKDPGYFHVQDIKRVSYIRNEELWKSFVIRDDGPYRAARLLHRCLIKYLAGRTEAAAGILEEINEFLNITPFSDEGQKSFEEMLKSCITLFDERYAAVPEGYKEELYRLLEEI